MKRTPILVGLVAIALSACVEDKIRDEIRDRQPDPTVDDNICAAMQSSTGKAIDAAVDARGDVPIVEDDGVRYDIALVDLGGPKQGVVRLDVAEASDYVAAIAENLTFVVTDLDGQPIEPRSDILGSDTCVELLVRREYTFSAGSYLFSFGPTSSPSVRLVVEPLPDAAGT